MQYKGKEISEELMEKAMQCDSVEEIIKLAGDNGIEISKEEAEAFLDEYSDIELDEEMLDMASGGGEYDCEDMVVTCDGKKKCKMRFNVKDKNRTDA